jgi:hypothetical protein
MPYELFGSLAYIGRDINTRSKIMKLDKDRSTDMVMFPYRETDKLMDAAEQAEKQNDTEALKWIFRRLFWLWQEGDVTGSDKYCYTVDLFNTAWSETIKNDPPPESIAAIIARIDEGEPEKEIAIADAGEALETVRAYLEENLGGKSYRAILESLNALQKAIKTTEDE